MLLILALKAVPEYATVRVAGVHEQIIPSFQQLDKRKTAIAFGVTEPPQITSCRSQKKKGTPFLLPLTLAWPGARDACISSSVKCRSSKFPII